MRTKCLAAFAAIVLFLTAIAWADKGADVRPTWAKPGKAVVQDTFDGPKLGKHWAVNKGDWQVRDGSLVGWEKKEDMHAAVLTLQQPFKDAIMRFSFKREGATGFNLSFNHAKGHLFRVIFNDDGMAINKDKDKKDAASKAMVLGKTDAKFASGEWHTVLVEILGDKVSVQADNGAKLQASHPGLAIEKTGYRFVTRGSLLLLDDVKVWQVEP